MCNGRRPSFGIRSWDLNPDLPCRWEEPSHLKLSLLCPGVCVSRKLESGSKARDQNWELLYGNVGILTARLHVSSKLTNFWSTVRSIIENPSPRMHHLQLQFYKNTCQTKKLCWKKAYIQCDRHLAFKLKTRIFLKFLFPQISVHNSCDNVTILKKII